MSGPQVVVELSQDGKRIELFSPYFPGVADMCKSVPGARWNHDKKFWSYPRNMQTCRLLRKTFTDMLIIGDELTAWAREAVRAEEAMASLTTKTDATLDRLPDVLPRVAQAMNDRTYQRVGAVYMANSPSGGVLLGDQPGLGKTVQTLGGIAERGIEEGLHLVACPATAVRITWEKEVRKWTDWEVFPVYGSNSARKKTLEAAFSSTAKTRFIIINPEMARVKLGRWCPQCKKFEEDFNNPAAHQMHIREGHKTQPRPYQVKFPELFEYEYSSITVDESHRFLAGISGPNKKPQVGEGLCRLRLRDGGLKVALSGTPSKGRLIKLWGSFHWLDPEAYRSKWQWAEQYFHISDNGFGKTIGELLPHREKDFYKSLDQIMLRRTKAEVAQDLPAKDYQEHWVDPSPEQAKQYRAMFDRGEAMFGDRMETAVGVLAELTRLKQIATAYQGADGPVMSKSCKWHYLLELLEERGVVGPEDERGGDEKYVIASQFTQVINAMALEFKKLGVDTLRITGEVSTAQRLEAQRQFQSEGGPRVMLINTMAGGVAIDLDAHCDELFFMDETFVPDEQEQVEDRIHRVSRVHQVTIHYLYAKGSIDESIAESNVSKDQIQKRVLDGRRGVDFAMRLLEGTAE